MDLSLKVETGAAIDPVEASNAPRGALEGLLKKDELSQDLDTLVEANVLQETVTSPLPWDAVVPVLDRIHKGLRSDSATATISTSIFEDENTQENTSGATSVSGATDEDAGDDLNAPGLDKGKGKMLQSMDSPIQTIAVTNKAGSLLEHAEDDSKGQVPSEGTSTEEHGITPAAGILDADAGYAHNSDQNHGTLTVHDVIKTGKANQRSPTIYEHEPSPQEGSSNPTPVVPAPAHLPPARNSFESTTYCHDESNGSNFHPGIKGNCFRDVRAGSYDDWGSTHGFPSQSTNSVAMLGLQKTRSTAAELVKQNTPSPPATAEHLTVKSARFLFQTAPQKVYSILYNSWKQKVVGGVAMSIAAGTGVALWNAGKDWGAAVATILGAGALVQGAMGIDKREAQAAGNGVPPAVNMV